MFGDLKKKTQNSKISHKINLSKTNKFPHKTQKKPAKRDFRKKTRNF
jgi:hypothetical protein